MIDTSSLNLPQLEQQYGLPNGLLSAVMQQESGGNPDAVSKTGAQGLFQFMPATAQQYGIDPTNPVESAQGAARFYGDLSKKYKGDVPSMLAAYNWGQGNVDRQGLANAPAETQNYIKSIQDRLGTQVADSGQIATDATVDNRPSLDEIFSAKEAKRPSLDEIFGDKASGSDKSATGDSFLGEMLNNAKGAVQAGKDLVSGDFDVLHPTLPSPKTEALADKLFTPDTVTNSPLKSAGAVWNNLRSNTSPSDWAGALLEQFGQNPAGKVVSVIGGLHPVFNAASTALNRYANPAIEKATGIEPDTLALLELAAPTLGLKKAGSISDPATALVKNAVTSATAPKAAIPTASDLAAQSNQKYTQATNLGANINPQLTDRFVNQIDALKPKPIAGKVLTTEDKAFINSLDDYKGLKGQPLTLDDAQRLDESLSNKIDATIENGRPNKMGKKLMDLQDNFRTMLEKPQPGDISGSSAGIEALSDARNLWARSRRMSDVERIISRAQGMDQPAKGMQSGFNTLLNNPNRMRGFSAPEKAAIKYAAKTGIVTDALRIMGSRLTPIAAGAAGYAAGGPLGAIASAAVEHGVSSMARNLAAKRQLDRALKVKSTIANVNRPGTLSALPLLISNTAQQLPNGAASSALAALLQQNEQSRMGRR